MAKPKKISNITRRKLVKMAAAMPALQQSDEFGNPKFKQRTVWGSHLLKEYGEYKVDGLPVVADRKYVIQEPVLIDQSHALIALYIVAESNEAGTGMDKVLEYIKACKAVYEKGLKKRPPFSRLWLWVRIKINQRFGIWPLPEVVQANMLNAELSKL